MNAERLREAIQAQTRLMGEVNQFIYAHPELGYEETVCSAYLVETFSKLGLLIEQPIVPEMETSFRATLAGDGGGPRVGLVLVYDAVPVIEADGSYSPNHSCGHNIIAGAIVGAVAALATLKPLPGSVVVMGAPADEIAAPKVANWGGGGKAITAAAGVYDDLDAALYAHPEFVNTVSLQSRWLQRYRIRLSHARRLSQRGELPGSTPAAVQELLKAIRLLEERHSQEYLMLQGLWLDGDVEGDCMVHAQGQVLVFGDTEEDIRARAAELREAVEAVSTAAEMPIALESLAEPHMGIRPNRALAQAVHQAMALAGLDVVFEPEPLPFATDFGNISHRVPGALIGVGREGGWAFHTLKGTEEFGAEEAERVMFGIADVLALTTNLLFEDAALIARIRAEGDSPISQPTG